MPDECREAIEEFEEFEESEEFEEFEEFELLGRWGEQILYRQSLGGAPSLPAPLSREARVGVQLRS